MLLALDSTVHPEGPKELEEVVDDLSQPWRDEHQEKNIQIDKRIKKREVNRRKWDSDFRKTPGDRKNWNGDSI